MTKAAKSATARRAQPALPEVQFADDGVVRTLHLGTEWVQGSMLIDKPYDIELEYVQRMMAWLLFVPADGITKRHAMQLGLGAGALTKFCHKKLRMRTTVIELNPQVIAACRGQGMAVVAYSPIAKGGAKRDAVLARIGKTHGKTGAQVSLRWLIQQGIGAIPRTSKVERLAENIAIFDFALSDDEMQEIAALARPGGRLVDWAWSPRWD